MPTFLDEAAITGVGTPAAGAHTVAPLPKDARFLDESAITGVGATERSVAEANTLGGKTKAVAADIGSYIAGNAGVAADLLLGIPAMVGGYFTHVTGRVGAQVKEPGISQKTAASAGAAYTESIIPEWAYSPLQSAVAKLSPEAKHYFEASGLGRLMGLISDKINVTADLAQEKTGLPAEDVKAAVNGLLGAYGAKGAKATVAHLVTRIEDAAKARKAAGEPGPEVDTSVPYDTSPAAVDPAARKAEIDAQLKAARDAKQAVGRHTKEAAKFTKMAEKLDEGDPLRATLEERAKISRDEAQRVEAEQTAAKATQVDEAARVKAEDLDARIGGEGVEVGGEGETGPSPGDAHRAALELRDIAAKPGHLRSAEEMIRLRAATKGSIDPDLLKWAAAGTLTALSGTLLYKLYNYVRQQGEQDDLHRELEQRQQEDETRRQNLDRPEPNPRPNPGTGGKIFTAMEDMSPVALAPFLAAGWVKAKGGMWHPEAVERLSVPLKDKLVSTLAPERGGVGNHPWVAADTAAATWSDKAIRNYLNKHAGTEADPLKDVVLPSGKTWGETTDKIIHNKRAGDAFVNWEKHVKTPDETVYNIMNTPRGWEQTDGGGPIRQVEDYLSHVGDYLRQNVRPEKLQQYDLVRAVKETGANDARVAKEMEKAAAASMKDMPVYKDYGDGMKWVELKLPEKLTEEQAKGVRVGKTEVGNPTHEALDAAGKPVVNSYTGDIARAGTPEEAHLAGQLAQEGNQMGHCVGGYCADVASGQTRILSLWDAKGRSHVTVELGQGSPRVEAGVYDPAVKSPDILQIKGKQNRAPDARYLPYVQDLVKGGKWGEVGDLGNTGLHDTQQSRTNSKPYNLLAEELYPGQRFLTEKEHNTLQTEGISRTINKDQRGSADPRLLAGIAAAGGITAYAALHPDKLQNLAALGLLALPIKALTPFREGMSQVAKGLDYIAGATSTRLGNISPALKLRARNYEQRVLEQTEKSLTAATPFLQVLQTAKPGSPLDLALLDDPARVRGVLKDQPAALKAWGAVEGMLKGFEQVHKDLGRFREGLSNYFPRLVDDLEGLKKAIGADQRTSLEQALQVAEAQMIKTRMRGLTDVETSIIVNNSLRARPAGSRLPGFAQERGVENVTEALRPFYATPTDSLLRYISAAIQDAEMAKFFGRDLKTKQIGGKLATDVDSSIGAVVEQEMKAGRISHDQMNDLRALLKSRFEGGERTMSAGLQDVRNLSNVALLGQFGSAATQIGDSVMTLYHHGLMPTLQALKQKLTGDSQVSGRDFGIVNHIAEELGSNRYTGKALQLVFKANGFGAIDQFAKGLNLNAGLLKNQRLASTQAGRAELAAKYSEAFGTDFPKLVQDLQSKTVSPEVKSLLFSELSDAQPISKMEMPQAYLEHPNGRLLYQMKTYMLKQMDVIRRDAYQEIAAGNYVRGAKNLVAVGAALALSNIPGDLIKDWLSGRPVDFTKIDYVEALLKNFGVSRFTMDQVSSGKPLEVLRDMALPPFKHYQELVNAATSGKAADQAKAMKYVPLVGRAVYDRELGGNEARFAADAKRLRLQLRDEREAQNPQLRAARLQRQENKRQTAATKLRNSMH